MKKRISMLFVIVALVLMMIIPSHKALAADQNILTLEATQSNGAITVKGTVEEGILAVAVAVYKEGSTEPVTMQTTEVNNSYEFSTSISLDAGDYIVKVADYNGGTFKEAKVTVEESSESSSSSTANSPKAGDNLIVFGIVLVGAVLVLVTALVMKNKKKE